MVRPRALRFQLICVEMRNKAEQFSRGDLNSVFESAGVIPA